MHLHHALSLDSACTKDYITSMKNMTPRYRTPADLAFLEREAAAYAANAVRKYRYADRLQNEPGYAESLGAPALEAVKQFVEAKKLAACAIAIAQNADKHLLPY